jgi:transcriptional regulator with XRE-family HTH domain
MNISQEELAELANVSIQTVKFIEGRRTWVSDTMLAKLAQALKVKSFQLLIPAKPEDPQDKGIVLYRELTQTLHSHLKETIDTFFARLG